MVRNNGTPGICRADAVLDSAPYPITASHSHAMASDEDVPMIDAPEPVLTSAKGKSKAVEAQAPTRDLENLPWSVLILFHVCTRLLMPNASY